MTDPEIKQIICGSFHTIICRNNGDVLVFGSNLYGQLGVGDYRNRNKPELLMTDPEIKQIICGFIIPSYTEIMVLFWSLVLMTMDN